MKRREVVKVLSVEIGITALLVDCPALLLLFADLSGWRDTVAEMISESPGHELTISGAIEPKFGLATNARLPLR